jgi:large subunit ribosomal protein L31
MKVETMKKDAHPDYHDITVVMTDGTEFTTRSTYGKKGDKLHLDIDSKTHPAWTGQFRMIDRGGQLAKFNKRFAGLTGKKDATPAAPAAPGEKIKLTTGSTAKKKKA